MPSQRCGHIPVQASLPPLPAEQLFYTEVKNKTGPKRKPLTQLIRAGVREVENQYQFNTLAVNIKLRVLSYWMGARIRVGPTKERQLTRVEVAQSIKIPTTNLYRRKKEEEKGKFATMRGEQRRTTGGGRRRMWPERERELFEKFRERRALGRPVQCGWFQRMS